MATRDNDIKYKYEGYWSDQSGWHFSFGKMRMWQNCSDYIVAEVRIEKGWEGERYSDHEKFDNMDDALDYMRTGKR